MFNSTHPELVSKELYLELLNLTMTSVAESLGVIRKTMTALINERVGVSVEIALKLVVVFDTTTKPSLNHQR